MQKIKKSVWKFPYSYKLSNFMDSKMHKSIFKRNITITSSLIGKKLHVHKGNRIGKTLVRVNMLGHKLGEFFVTKIIGDRIAYRKKLKLKQKNLKQKKNNGTLSKSYRVAFRTYIFVRR